MLDDDKEYEKFCKETKAYRELERLLGCLETDDYRLKALRKFGRAKLVSMIVAFVVEGERIGLTTDSQIDARETLLELARPFSVLSEKREGLRNLFAPGGDHK